MARYGMRQRLLWEELPKEPAPGLRDVKVFLDVLSEFDEPLVRELQRRRGCGRDDYPIVAMWNLYAVQSILRRCTMAQALEELRRNTALVEILGFLPQKDGTYLHPAGDNCSRFHTVLKSPEIYQMVEEILNATVRRLKELIPDLGRHTAEDATDIPTHAKAPSKEGKEASSDNEAGSSVKTEHHEDKDGKKASSDPEASWSVKTKQYQDKEGKVHEEKKCTFGYKHYALVDVEHAAVLAAATETGSTSDYSQVEPLLSRAIQNVGEGEIKTLALDKGFDSEKIVTTVYDLGVKAVVPFRDVPKNLDALPPEDREERLVGASNIVRDKYTGKVACYDSSGPSPIRREMVYAGFEASRQCHKFRCPLAAIGRRCEYSDRCQAGRNGADSRQVRVPMSVDPRRFGPIYRHSKRWKRIYRGRTAAERYNSYVKRVLRLDQHCLRGRSAIGLRALMCAITVNIRLLIRVQEQRAAEAKAA